nr:hypothetical protein [uncultured Bacillus sp.]
MSNKFQKLEYIQFYKGSGKIYCQVDAQHATPPLSDLYTGKLVKEIVLQTECAGIISTVSRSIADLNRKKDGHNNRAIQQYRIVMKEILDHLGILNHQHQTVLKPFLHLTIHGMKDEHYGPFAIEIGTFNGKSCSRKVRKWFQKIIGLKAGEIMPQIKIRFDQYFVGDESIVFHRLGDGSGYPGYGYHFHTFQIEISRTLREQHLTELAKLLSYVIKAFQTDIVAEKAE